MTEELPTSAYLIGEPGWQKLLWNENELKVQSNYESFDEVKQTSIQNQDFEYSELVRRQDVEQLIKDRITSYDDRELNDVEYGRYKELLNLLHEVQKSK